MTRLNAAKRLKQKLQRELHQPAWLRSLDLAEIRRIDVVFRQAEIRVIEDVEPFSAELNRFAFGDFEIFQCGKIPLLQSGTLRNVSAGVAELPGLCNRIEPLESARTKPAVRSSGARTVRKMAFREIANYVWTVARKAGNFRSASLRGGSRGIVNRERRSAHESRNAVYLPASLVCEERQISLIARHKTMTRVKHRAAALFAEVEWILREIVFPGGALRSGTGDARSPQTARPRQSSPSKTWGLYGRCDGYQQ